MFQGKRLHAVKVLLNDEEMVELLQQAAIENRDRSSCLLNGWLESRFGRVGLARLRAKRNRGSDEELLPADFQDTQAHNGAQGG